MLAERMLRYYASITNPDALQEVSARTPFKRGHNVLNKRLIAQFTTTSTGDTAEQAILLDPSNGAVIVSAGAAVQVPAISAFGSAWAAASKGTAATSGAFSFGGGTAVATLAPIGAGTHPWAVMAVVQLPADTSAQTFVDRLGALGNGRDGGFSVLDGAGHAVLSWNPAMLGRTVVDQRQLARVPVGGQDVLTSGFGTREVTTIIRRSGNGTSVVFREPTHELFADLRQQQRVHDLTILTTLAVAILCLVAVSMLGLRTARRVQARLDALLTYGRDLLIVFGVDGRTSYTSPAVAELLARPPATCRGLLADQLTHPDDRGRLTRMIENPVEIPTLLDLRLGTKAAGYRWFDVEATDLRSDPDLRGTLLTCHDVGEHKALQDQLITQARHDALTGLPNRTMLLRALTDTLRGRIASRDGSATNQDGQIRAGLLFVDLDRFKQVNDNYGHESGDQVLQTVSERMRALMRAGDLVCRLGGDEFGIVLAGVDQRITLNLAERLISAVSEPISILPPAGPESDQAADPVQVQVGASVGIALSGLRLNDPESLLRAADAAMYGAKHDGGGRAAVTEGPDHLDGAVIMEPRPGQPGVPTPIGPPERSAFSPLMDAPTEGAALRPTRTWQPRYPSPLPPVGRRRAPSLGSVAALMVTVVGILTLAGVGAWQNDQSHLRAEQQRLNERLQLTARVAQYVIRVSDLDRLIAPVNAAPWTFDGSVVNAIIMRGVLASAIGGGSAATLIRADGKVLAQSGPELPPGIEVGSAQWKEALAGHVATDPIVSYHGQYYVSAAIPISRDDAVVAVLITAQMLVNSQTEQMLKVLGSLGFGNGGISVLNADGIATQSWDPALIGRRLVPATELAVANDAQAHLVAGPAGTTTLVASIPTRPAGQRMVIVFQQTTATLYGDLRSGQTLRDLPLLGIALIAVALVGLSGWQRERLLRRAGARVDALMRHAHDIVLVTVTRNGRQEMTFVSTAITELLGHQPREWVGRDLLSLVHPEDREKAERCLQGTKTAEQVARNVRLSTYDASYRWFDIKAIDLSDQPQVAGIVVTCHEIGQRKAAQDELAYHARHDALTGLPNRSAFNEHLEFLASGDRNDESPQINNEGYTVFFIDLDRFKPVNDAFGHEAGDAVLRAVAHRLAEVAADHPGVTVARLGGDEFAMLGLGTDTELGARLATSILERVGRPIAIPGHDGLTVQVGVTIGIAHSRSGTPPASTLRRADEAMYQAKEAGRGRFTVSAS